MHAILLAAGTGSRFGGPKLLAPVGGRPMLLHVLDRLVAVVGAEHVVVVLGAQAGEIRPYVRRTGASAVDNASYTEGIGSSIRTGVAGLPSRAEAVLIALADQPAVHVDELRALVSRWREDPARIVAAAYAGTNGVPAVFPADLFGELAALHGDHGAKALLARYRDRVLAIPMPSAALDVDTPADLLRL